MAPVNSQSRTLASDLGALLKLGKFSDITLVVGETQLAAHKAVLAARSPVLEAMLSHSTSEARSGRIEIIDVEADVLRQLLVFFYTDDTPDLQKMATQLFEVADKYEVMVLKERCEQWMSQNITVDNAADVAVAAVQHSSPELRNSAIRFIKYHLVDVMATEGWAEAVRTYPETIIEISKLLRAAAPHKRHMNKVVSEVETKKLNKELLRAAESGDVDQLETLLENGAQLAVRGEVEWTALHCAAEKGHEGAVRCLVDKGARVDIKDIFQQTPLHLASMNGHVSVVRQLLDVSVDINTRGYVEQTPLHWAVLNSHVEVVRLLLQAGASRDVRDIRGWTPLDVAVRMGRHQLVEILREG